VPHTRVLLYKEADGHVPVKAWLEDLHHKDRRAFAKCVDRIQRLAALGHELRRPHVDVLRDSIHELRARQGTVHYRILYFYHGKNLVVLAHAFTKEGRVPAAEIERAITRREALERDPAAHLYQEDDDGEEEDQ